MKMKFFLMLAMAAVMLSLGTQTAYAQCNKCVKNGHEKAALMHALQNRKSTRTFTKDVIPDSLLQDLLWAANGVNRADGKRTAPSAINAQDIELYVAVNGKGSFHYDAQAKKLNKVTDEDFRTILSVQRPVYESPVNILLVTNQAKFKGFGAAMTLAAMDAGYVSQNICIFCAATGLGTVPCAPKMDAAAIQKMLGLSSDYIPLIYHPVGYPREPAK